jgi:hypothetical protein
MESSTLAAREGADGCPFAGDVKLNKAAITQESARQQFPGFMADEYTQRVVAAAWHTHLTAGSNNMSTVKNPEEKKRLSLARIAATDTVRTANLAARISNAESNVDTWTSAEVLARRLVGCRDPFKKTRRRKQSSELRRGSLTANGEDSENGLILLSESCWRLREPEKSQSNSDARCWHLTHERHTMH